MVLTKQYQLDREMDNLWKGIKVVINSYMLIKFNCGSDLIVEEMNMEVK